MRSSSIIKFKSFCIINISWYYFKEDEYMDYLFKAVHKIDYDAEREEAMNEKFGIID